MALTYQNLTNLKFPVYPLRSNNWTILDGVVFVEGLVVDERNMPGKSLGIRRAQSGRRDLYKLRKPIIDFPSMLKSHAPAFIDSKGKVFTYEKTYSSKLITYRIAKVVKKEVASLLYLQGIQTPFSIPRPPPPEYEWARVLHIEDRPWLLYDYVRDYLKPTYRRI